MVQRRINRRSFLAAAAGGLVASRITAAQTTARPAGANERVTLGFIGVGGQGTALLKMALEAKVFDVAAVCDVDTTHAQRAAALVGGNVREYPDFRRVLDQKDIDAVVVAVPDHWHALVVTAACQAGKDVYCEKPLSYTIAEGRAMVAAARRHRRVVQTGTHHRCDEDIRTACELIRSGRIGRVDKVEMWIWANPFEPKTPGSDPPPGLNWDMWLGPAPFVPYHPKRCHFNFRWIRDYAGFYMTDWGAHMINVVTWALDCDLTGPVLVEGRESPFEKEGLWDAPARQEVRWVYQKPAFEMTWTQPGPPDRKETYGIRFHGSEGVLFVKFGAHELSRDGKVVADVPRPGSRSGDVTLPRFPSNLMNWYEAIRDPKTPLLSDVEIGHRNASVCHLGNIAARLGRPLKWDPVRERFIGDAEADKLLERPYRAPWKLA